MRNFSFACIMTLEERLCKALALWAALRLAGEGRVCHTSCIALELAVRGDKLSTEAATALVWDVEIESGIRSAILAQTVPNFRLHTYHSVSELARVFGWSLISNTLADILETGDMKAS